MSRSQRQDTQGAFYETRTRQASVPALLDLMDAETGTPLPGKSLVPCIRDGRDRGPVIVEWHPGETTNLFGQSGHDARVRGMTAAIHAWQETVGDSLEIDV